MRLQLDTSLAGTIESTGTAAVGTQVAGLRGSVSAGTSAEAAGSTDSALISGPSNLLGRLSTDRGARIEQLTASVQTGSYQVSSALIGRALITEALV